MNVKTVLGGVMGFLDEDFETENYLRRTTSTVVEAEEKEKKPAMPDKGSIDFTEDLAARKAFFQGLKEDMDRTQRAKDKLLFEEEIWDIATNLPTEQINQLLHYQKSYRNNRSIYQKAELRLKLEEQKVQEETQEKAASIPSPAKKANSLEVAFEGASGSKGNLSFQAVG